MKYFVLHDENEEITYRLPLVSCSMDFQDFLDIVSESDMTWLEETYGVHDASWDESKNEFLGFTSSEVEDWDFVKNYWEKWLRETGFVIGKKGWKKIKAA
jgi:hypothetical protein